MYKKELPRVAPESVGLSSARALRLMKELEAATEMHGFMLARHGQVVAESWWAPYTADFPHICHSLGKSYVATGVALAIADGLMTVEDRIVDPFAREIEELGVEVTENLRALRVKHLLTMSNGMARHPALDENLVRNYLTEPIVYRPGTRFMYNTAGTSMLGEIVTRLTGRSLHEYMGEKLFEKIGIERDKLLWLPYKNGLDASPGIATTTENNLRLGLLYLNGGSWDGEALLPPDYVRAATTTQMDNKSFGTTKDEQSGYGYQIWMCAVPGAYRFDGGHGQLTYISPAHDVVFSINQSGMMPSATTRVQQLIAAFLSEPMSGESLPANEADYQALRAWAASRRLPEGTVTRLPDEPGRLDGLYRVCSGEFHIYPELRANDRDNLDRAFYSIDDEYCKTLSIRTLSDREIEITLDHFARLLVRLDGRLEPIKTNCAIRTYDVSCSTGYYDGPDTLVVHMRWLHTCLSSTLRLTRYPNELLIDVAKSTLHETSTEIRYIARAKPL